MSSRRKSSTPCMVRVVMENQNPEPLEQEERSGDKDQPSVIEDVEATEEKDKNREGVESDPASQKQQPRGYECKYCPFSTQNLNEFKDHVDSSHPNVILNPLYLCAVCNFNTKKFDSLTEHNESQHPGETNFKFKRIKQREMVPPCISTTVKTPGNTQSLYQGSELKSKRDCLIQKNQITAVNINGTVIIPEPTILQGLSHVTPLLQRPPNFNSVPKIAVPLNTTKYNPSLDDNLTLITSFSKFPYPTHAELSWLTAASKHPEDQIKVWFTTQRLKQGITWSPEEVEEARKKMFNGSIPPAHHTFTVLPNNPISQPSAKSSQQSFVHTTVGHASYVRTSTSNGLSVVATTNSPAGAAIGSIPSLKRSLPTHLTTVFGPESKRPIMAVAPHSGDAKDRGDKVLTPLAEANGTSRRDGKRSYNQTSLAHNNGVMHLDGSELPAVLKTDFQQKSLVLTQFPLLERMKGKTAEQLKILEENFLRNSFPTLSDVDNLAGTTRLSHQEIDSWFVERRALRDNLEQALLNSMGTKRMDSGDVSAITKKRLHQQQQQHQTLQLNGIHKPSTGVGHLKSLLPPSSALPIIAPSIPNPNSCSVPPDSRSLALLKDNFAQTRWPSPEEFSQLEGRTGRAELARWFDNSRLQSGSMELTELFHNNGVNGGQGLPVCSPKIAPPSILQRCQEGALTNNNTNNSSKVLEVELGWLMEQRANSLSSQQHDEIQDRFAGRYCIFNIKSLYFLVLLKGTFGCISEDVLDLSWKQWSCIVSHTFYIKET
uniref:Homeobox domain-containing protein n=1 Tax=Sander lucioperca TaxID=283035 RepID=A0A8D0D660_SANLU